MRVLRAGWPGALVPLGAAAIGVVLVASRRSSQRAMMPDQDDSGRSRPGVTLSRRTQDLPNPDSGNGAHDIPGKNRQRRAWIINHYANPPSVPGGTRHHELAALMTRHGWATTIMASAFNHRSVAFERPVSLAKPARTTIEDGVAFTWLWSLPYQANNWRRYANMASFLVVSVGAGLFRNRPDVVIGSSPHLFAPLGAWLLARRHRVPFVLEVRDLWPASLVQLGLDNRPVIALLTWLERFLYARADHIVALTEGIADGIKARGVDRDSISLISNAAMRPAPLDPSERTATRSRMGWTDARVAIWIGAHGPANGLDVLIDAARLVQHDTGIRLVLVGDGAAKPGLVEAARDLPNMEFLDPVPKQDVMALLRAADVGVIVHRDTEAVKGARPNKLFDYMAAGLPILLNLDGEARRLVEEANAGVHVPTESAPAIADGLRHLLAAPTNRATMGRSGYARASAAHSREDTAAELAGLLDHLTTNRVSSAVHHQWTTE